MNAMYYNIDYTLVFSLITLSFVSLEKWAGGVAEEEKVGLGGICNNSTLLSIIFHHFTYGWLS